MSLPGLGAQAVVEQHGAHDCQDHEYRLSKNVLRNYFAEVNARHCSQQRGGKKNGRVNHHLLIQYAVQRKSHDAVAVDNEKIANKIGAERVARRILIRQKQDNGRSANRCGAAGKTA